MLKAVGRKMDPPMPVTRAFVTDAKNKNFSRLRLRSVVGGLRNRQVAGEKGRFVLQLKEGSLVCDPDANTTKTLREPATTPATSETPVPSPPNQLPATPSSNRRRSNTRVPP